MMSERAPSGLYLYCIAMQGCCGDLTVSAPALNGAGVRSISHSGLLVVAHDCPAEPYQGSPEDVRAWILAHNAVVTQVWEKIGTVLPMAFDSIVTGDGDRSAESVLADWLGEHRDELSRSLTELDGKVELGVRVYYDDAPAGAAERGAVPRGREYFQSQLLKRREAAELQIRLSTQATRIVAELGARAQSIRVNTPNTVTPSEGIPGCRELLSVSLLVDRRGVGEVGAFLDSITAAGHQVRFTGPWPPYSFAGSLRVSDREIVNGA